MKIYFIGAISQLPTFGNYYRRVVDCLENKGYLVQSNHVLGQNLDKVMNSGDEQKIDYYKKFLKWVNEAEMIVAETSFPSTVNIGHEVSVALEKGKPVVVLYKRGKSPVFLEGINSERLIIEEYTDDNLEEVLLSAVGFASSQQDTRFNFFISPKIGAYLDWVSRNKRVPRAVYLRNLIKGDMEKSKYRNN